MMNSPLDLFRVAFKDGEMVDAGNFGAASWMWARYNSSSSTNVRTKCLWVDFGLVLMVMSSECASGVMQKLSDEAWTPSASGDGLVSIVGLLKVNDICWNFCNGDVIETFIKSGVCSCFHSCGFRTMPWCVLSCVWDTSKEHTFL